MTTTVVIPSTMSYDGTTHTYTDDSDPTTGLDGGGHVDRFVPAIKDVVSVTNYAVSYIDDNTTLSKEWATKVTGEVISTEGYAAKAWAIGGTGVDTIDGSAKDWATKLTTVGNTTLYGAKKYATDASSSASNASTSESNALTYKNNALTSANNASTSEGNALTYKNNALTSANNASTSESNALTYKNNANNWATKTNGEAETGLGYSAKAHAIGGTGVTSVTGSAKDWATLATTEVVTGQGYSAKQYATNAAGSASTATTQAGIATTQASTATTQAGIATTQASNALTSANNAATSATAAANSAATLTATSTTSTLIATGAKTFTTQSGKQFQAGQTLKIVSQANSVNFMVANVTSYSTTSLTVNVTSIGGSGTLADWNISVSGIKGDVGANGSVNIGATTNITGIIKGAAGALSAATAGTDYVKPNTATTFTATQSFESTADSVTLGSELITNGTFTGNATGWNLGAGWTYSSNTARILFSGAMGTLSQSISVTSGKSYLVSYVAVPNGGTDSLNITTYIGASIGNTVVGNSTQVIYATQTGSVLISFAPTSTSTSGEINIDYISVKEITGVTPIVKYKSLSGTDSCDHRIMGYSLFIGQDSGKFNSGFYNISFGYKTLSANTSGAYNTAIGYNSLNKNNTGDHNISVGYNTLGSSIASKYNCAFGNEALSLSKSGDNNSAFGNKALQLATYSSDNSAFGSGALGNMTVGYSNCAFGGGAFGNATGICTSSSAFGFAALTSLSAYINCTGIGFNAQVAGSNQMKLGDTNVTVYTNSGTVSVSDIRDKADIRDTILGLNFINSVRPVDYRWDIRADYAPKMPESIAIPENATDEEKAVIELENKTARELWIESVKPANLIHDGTHKRSRYHHGVIAQEMQALVASTGIDFGGWQNFEVAGGEDAQAIRYEEFIAPLIKAVQELSARVVELEAKL